MSEAVLTVPGRQKSMSDIDILDSFEGDIEKDLEELFAIEIKKSEEYYPFIGKIYESLQEFVLRSGRRLAACSTLMVYKGYTGIVNQNILRACSGIELYRHSILVHDDIVDNEIMRRGGPALHETLAEQYDKHLGESAALFAGNMLFSMALGAILDSGFEPEKIDKSIGLLRSEYKDLNESQILDLLFEYKEPSIKEWEIMASKRAASLFKVSLLTGAILASAPERDLEAIESAANHIGFAFDIQDDIIDTFATREQYGRDPCGDISKRKKPLHIAIALERDRRLASIMEKSHEFSDEGIREIQDLIRDCGALDEAKSISINHARAAQRLLSATEMNDQEKDFFISFIEYVAESLEWYK